MHRGTVLRIVSLASLAAGAAFAAPQAGIAPSRTIMPLSRTVLEIQNFGGEFSQWTRSWTITGPEALTFRWRTDETGVSGATWQVSDTPFPGLGPQANTGPAPHVIASGYLSKVPAPGKISVFGINFGQFVPKQPPSAPKRYYVRVLPQSGPNQWVGSPSPAVTVTYTKPGPATKFDEFVPPDVKIPMPVRVHLSSFKVVNADEDSTLSDGDEPYLYVAAVFADGTTIKALDPAGRSVRLMSASKAHDNITSDDPDGGETYAVPAETGRFDTTILPIGLDVVNVLGLDSCMKMARVGLVVAMEEDATSDSAANEGRKALVSNLQKELDNFVRTAGPGDDLKVKTIQNALEDKVRGAIKSETLGDLWKPWGFFAVADPDDHIGTDFRMVTYKDIRDAGVHGIPFTMVFKKSGVEYQVTGSIGRK